jgi:nicotinamide riboside kinase
MILFVEGPRHSGKTYLIEQFIAQCNDPRIEYYKFYFANHLKTLHLEWQEDQPGLHYFSLGNIMTILEMNQRGAYRDKIWIFDRAIISAYAWAILRGRLSHIKAYSEIRRVFGLDLYQNCKTIFVSADGNTLDSTRQKDHWDGAVKTGDETHLMLDLIQSNIYDIADINKGNGFYSIKNEFDQVAINHFIESCNSALGLNK